MSGVSGFRFFGIESFSDLVEEGNFGHFFLESKLWYSVRALLRREEIDFESFEPDWSMTCFQTRIDSLKEVTWVSTRASYTLSKAWSSVPPAAFKLSTVFMNMIAKLIHVSRT